MTSFEQNMKATCRMNRRQCVEKSVKKRIKRTGKTVYKHVPHSEKPPHLVARRNARERRRVETVNNAFLRLRKHVPMDTKHKRLSKVKTLRYAIDYIKRLTAMIDNHDKHFGAPCCNFGRSVSMVTPNTEERGRLLYKARDINTEVTSYGWFSSP